MFTYQEYYKQCESVARDIIAEYKENQEDIDYIDLLDQTIDQHEYIIYYGKALQVLVHSENWTAIDEMGLEPRDNIADQIAQAAYYAMHADVYRYLETMLEDEEL